MFDKKNIYIPLRELPNRETFLPGVKQICELVGTSFPRYSFPADELPQELALNLERIEKIRKAKLPENLRDAENVRAGVIQILEGLHEMTERVGRLHQLGFSKSAILKNLKKLGSIG